MSNNAETVKIIDTRDDAITVPNVILETAAGFRLSLPYTWEDLDKLDDQYLHKEQENIKNGEEKSND